MTPPPPSLTARDHTTPDLAAESLRTYLLCVAEELLAPDLRAKNSASDLVQQTLLAAHRARDTFRGNSRGQLLAWLRAILRHTLANCRKHWHSGACAVLREVPLEHVDAADGLASCDSPSQAAQEAERHRRLAEAVARLPHDYQRVLVLRLDAGHSFAEVGRRLGDRSEDAARMLFQRAVGELRRSVPPQDC